MSDPGAEPGRELSVADMRKVMASILDVLECPVCYQELYSPIYQCNNGHPVCSSCRPRVRACPVCKSWMYHVRALTLEKIVREMPRPCRYTAGGCTERLGVASRAQHERRCPRRPARCVEALVPCSWKGPLAKARAHLWDEHQLAHRLHRAMHGRFSFSVGCVGQEKFLEDTAESVLFRCLIRAERGRLHFLCHALVAADTAEMYAFRVLVTTRCSERRLSYEGPVTSVFQSITRTIEASQGLRVGRDWLIKACSCRAGELCFDTTWQLSRRSELLQAERDLRTILAGAYPEPHGGSHDQAVHATPRSTPTEPRTFTPSRSRQQTPNVTPSDSRAGLDQRTPASPPAGHLGHQDDLSEEEAALPTSQQESDADTGERPPSSSQEECLRPPPVSSRTSERERSASIGTIDGEAGFSTSTPELVSEASASTHEAMIGSSTSKPQVVPETSTSAPDVVPQASAITPEDDADVPLSTGEAADANNSAAARSPAVSEVSAACYAAAVARLATVITPRLAEPSRDVETPSSPPNTASSSQSDTVTTSRHVIVASQPQVASSDPETAPSLQMSAIPESKPCQSADIARTSAAQPYTATGAPEMTTSSRQPPPGTATNPEPTPEPAANPRG